MAVSEGKKSVEELADEKIIQEKIDNGLFQYLDSLPKIQGYAVTMQEEMMPYQTVNELPDNVKSLPAHAKEIYMKAFNNAFDQYEGEEHKAHAVAGRSCKNSGTRIGRHSVTARKQGDCLFVPERIDICGS